jgi:hypothetical protein
VFKQLGAEDNIWEEDRRGSKEILMTAMTWKTKQKWFDFLHRQEIFAYRLLETNSHTFINIKTFWNFPNSKELPKCFNINKCA